MNRWSQLTLTRRVPLTIMMQNRPKESMLAVTQITGRLCSDQNAFSQSIICAPQTVSLTNGLRTHNEMVPDVEQEPSPWDMNLGLYSEVLPFWDSRIDVTLIQVEQSRWVTDVLPGLGYNRIRLLEMTFPPPLPGHTSAVAQFDKAKRALDERRYGDCILGCRGLLNMWERQLGATAKKRIAEVVAADGAWPEGDIRRDLLDTLWKEVGDVANAPHHPEEDVNAEIFEGRDARLVLMLTATLSEYLERQ